MKLSLVFLSTAIIAIVLCGSRTSPSEAPLTAVNNVFTGSCGALDLYILTTGVFDDLGVNHPGSEGWTNPHFAVSDPTYTTIPQQKTRTVCIRADVQVIFSASPISNVIVWKPNPPGCNTCSCNFEVSNWQEQVNKHEFVHSTDYRELAKQWTLKWRNREFTACAQNSREAWRLLRLQVKAALDSDLSALNAAGRKKADDFHKSPESHTTPPDCSACAACATGQSPHGCPNCSKCEGGQCRPFQCTPKGSLCCGAACCGFSNANQPISCCVINGVPTCNPQRTSGPCASPTP
jgi:hypothetical protein